jgi:hypothetical protein
MIQEWTSANCIIYSHTFHTPYRIRNLPIAPLYVGSFLVHICTQNTSSFQLAVQLEDKYVYKSGRFRRHANGWWLWLSSEAVSLGTKRIIREHGITSWLCLSISTPIIVYYIMSLQSHDARKLLIRASVAWNSWVSSHPPHYPFYWDLRLHSTDVERCPAR